MAMPDWAWRRVLRWGEVRSIGDNLSGREQLEVALALLGPGLRHHLIRPLRDWLYRTLPLAALLLRLEPAGQGWHRVPNHGAALHAFFKLGVICHEDDFLRIKGGQMVAIGVVDEDSDRCEFWLPDEIGGAEPRP